MFTKYMESFVNYIKIHWLLVVIFFLTLCLGFGVIIGLSWLIGYYSNALLDTHFEINSCWQGISVEVTLLAGVMGLAKAAWTKYDIDSRFNSEEGSHPYEAKGE